MIQVLNPMLLVCQSRLSCSIHSSYLRSKPAPLRSPKTRLHVSMCVALNASITGEEPRKQFAIGLTVEQISQCSGSSSQQKQFCKKAAASWSTRQAGASISRRHWQWTRRVTGLKWTGGGVKSRDDHADVRHASGGANRFILIVIAGQRVLVIKK